MSFPISTVISVSLSYNTRGISQVGFGTPNILTDEDSGWGGELVRRYSSLDGVLEDFASSTETYKAAAAIFAQSPHPQEIVISAEGSRVAQVVTVVFDDDIITGNSIAIDVDGTDLTQAFDTSNSTTLAALATQIQALPTIATAVSNGTDTITITAVTAGASIEVGTAVITGGASQAEAVTTTTTANVGPAEFLAAIRNEDDDWYALVWTERNQYLVQECAAYIQTSRKIFVTCTDDNDVLDDTVTTDVASVLQSKNYTRTFIIWNDAPLDFADAAWLGNCLTFDPGEETWKFKTLIGITADTYTQNELANLKAKNCNSYTNIGGRDVTGEGVMASGEFIDNIRSGDWIVARVEEAVYLLFVNNPKVPYTNEGFGKISNAIGGVLENGRSQGLISNDPLEPASRDKRRSTQPYVITIPNARDVPFNDRANRLATGIQFEALLASAIHKVTIEGVVTI